jgi:hypothetical protein
MIDLRTDLNFFFVHLFSLVKNAVCIIRMIYFSTHWLLDCGDVTDVTTNNGVFGAESECATPCPGDPIHLCGNNNRLNTYYWNGPLNVWHTPTNTGRYEVSFISCTDSMSLLMSIILVFG